MQEIAQEIEMIEHLYINNKRTGLENGDMLIYKDDTKTVGFYRGGRRIYLGSDKDPQHDDKLTTVFDNINCILKHITLFTPFDLELAKDKESPQHSTKWILVKSK